MEFIPAGGQAFPPTSVTDVEPSHVVAYFQDQPDWDSGARVPAQPCVVVGKLKFAPAWHYLEKVPACPAQEGLVAYHVGLVGGHAILRCEVFETSRGIIQRGDTGQLATVSYRALELDVIRYGEPGQS